MNSLMAAPQGSNIELWKARADSSSDVQGEDIVLDTPKEMRFLLEISQIVDPSLRLRKRRGEPQKQSDGGLRCVVEGTYTTCLSMLNKPNEFGAVNVGWTGGKSRGRENVENVVVIIDNVSYLPDLAQSTSYIRPKPLHQTVRTLLPVS